MPYEVECGECHKQILIEDLGVEVSCPYCQTTLILTKEDLCRRDEASSAEDSHVVTSDEASFDFNFSESSSSVLANGESGDSHLSGSGVSSAILEEPPPEQTDVEEDVAEEDVPDFNFLSSPGDDATLDSDEPETREDIPNYELEGPPTAAATSTAPSQSAADEVPDFNLTDSADDKPADVPAISIDTGTPSPREPRRKRASDEKPKAKSAGRADSSDEPAPPHSAYARRTESYSPRVVYSLISYSILVTICFLYLLMKFNLAKPHQLESLPDIAPPEEGQFRLIRENAILAPGHTLNMDDSQRFGNIRIKPLRVTRGPLQFEYFRNDRLGGSLPPTRPVLKLWLEIENVSQDQIFAPLDLNMLTIREHNPEDYDLIHAHNWVCRKADLSKRTHRVLMFNHPATSEYDITGLVTRPLKPGEKIETFLPTQEEGLGELKGPLVWRFQIRKGFNPNSMNGVTTLVEVEFSSDDIVKDRS